MPTMFRYILRVLRMIDLFARGSIDFANFKHSFRPGQITVLARDGGMLFCDADTERMAFGVD